jgi:ribose transport system permease protein
MAVLFVVQPHRAVEDDLRPRSIYLTGGNREAAIYSGINVDRIKIIVFMISGVMAAISGILLSSRLSSAQTNAGMGYELDAIAAAVLGGTSLPAASAPWSAPSSAR